MNEGRSGKPVTPAAVLFLRSILRAAKEPAIYAVGLAVGVVINLLQSGMPFSSWVPFVVPVLVQIFTRAWIMFSGRNTDRLLSISQERDEPSFICDDEGNFLVTSGRPAAYLERERIDSLQRLFGGTASVPSAIADQAELGKTTEFYSPVLDTWFSVHVRRSEVGWMVWLVDITERRKLDERQRNIDQFRNHIMKDPEAVAREGDIDRRTARLILASGWRCVFIAIADDRDDDRATSLIGRVYKVTQGECEVSSPIRVDRDSDAPIWYSRRDKYVIIARRSEFPDQKAWEFAYPLHPDVNSFLGHPYPVDLINWHEGNYTVIAFDHRGGLKPVDVQAFDGLVGTAHTVRTLIDLARAADARFLQQVTGLSAAAESSDEITGRHIHRVNVYAETLGRHIGLDDETCRWLGQISALHDIGKVAMPHIIKKPGKLTEEEYREMQMHPIEGFRILRQMIESQAIPEPRLVQAAVIALNHHQCWDGSGYPALIDSRGAMTMMKSRRPEDYSELRPLQGKEIPVESLIVGLADKYDALRSPRQYKPPFDHEKTMRLLAHDDRYGKTAEEVFGSFVWNSFLPIAHRFARIYEEMRDQ